MKMRFSSLCNRCLLKLIRPYSSTSSSIPIITTNTEVISTTTTTSTTENDENNNNDLIAEIDDNVPELWTTEAKAKYNKTYANKMAHVTAVNQFSQEKTILQLKIPKNYLKQTAPKQSYLPLEVKEGLKHSLMDCKQPIKVLQAQADDLTQKLAKRRFPASPWEIRAARKEVIEKIKEDDMEIENMLRDPKQAPTVNRLIYRRAQRLLAKQRYNWAPLNIESREQAAVFALSRLPAYFAEVQNVLCEFDRVKYVPETILDYGSGIGAAFWAAYDKWGENIKQYSFVDENFHMRNFSMDLLRGRNYTGNGEFIFKNVYFRKNLLPSVQNKYDMVILHRTLIEMPSAEARIDLINTLWQRTNKYLVIIDSPMSESFQAIMSIRDYILTASNDFDYDYVKEILDQKGLLNMKLIHFLADKRVSDYEKMCIVQEKLGNEFIIPTKVEPGYVFAPCPHDQGCPKISKEKVLSCRFKVRLLESRADHKTESINRDGTLINSFSYVIMEKGKRPILTNNETPSARVLELYKGRRCISCQICSAFDGIQNFTVSRRANFVYRYVKGAKTNQLLPVESKVVKSTSEMNFVREILLPEKENE